MNESAIREYITNTFKGVETSEAYGYTFFFYRSERKLPFATLIATNTEYDQLSNLDRPGVYRLNIGVSKQTFQTLFGKDQVDIGAYDYTALDKIMPHPEYATQSFVCVLSPGDATLKQVQALLAEAHNIAVQRFNRQNQEK